MQDKKLLSVILPVYQGAELVEAALDATLKMREQLPAGWALEVVVVDDGSTDSSLALIKAAQQRHPETICAVSLSKNHGAIIALRAALNHARGDLVTFISQDLQETPDMLMALFESWREHGGRLHILRRGRRFEPLRKRLPAQLYHAFMKKFVIPNYPGGGVATLLIDKTIVRHLKQNATRHADLATEILSLGYPCRVLSADRPAGAPTGWTLTKNINLALDNIISFSRLLIRFMILLGLFVAFCGGAFAMYVFVGKATGWYVIHQPPGWATLVILISVFSGCFMLMFGIVGEYLWRILDYSRNKPLYYVDETIDAREPRP